MEPINNQFNIERLEKLWGKAVSQFGFTQLPNLLMFHMKDLGLKAPDVIFLIHLISHGLSWENNFPICLSMKEMAKVTGMAYNTILAAKKRLESNGFITISAVRNQMRTNTYDLNPLMEKLNGLVEPVMTQQP
jgi:hypothetical protein